MARRKKEKVEVPEPFIEGMHFVGYMIVDRHGLEPCRARPNKSLGRVQGYANGYRNVFIAPMFIPAAVAVAEAFKQMDGGTGQYISPRQRRINHLPEEQ